jgi:hypothetical protein
MFFLRNFAPDRCFSRVRRDQDFLLRGAIHSSMCDPGLPEPHEVRGSIDRQEIRG